MSDRESAGRRAREFFEDLWSRGDPWKLETSPFERARYERQVALLAGRRYDRALEIGCGGGAFTRDLATLADRVVAIDVSPAAIARAKAGATTGATIGAVPGTIEFRVANVMELDLRADGPWDLVVLSETIYYLGWLYPFFDVGWLAHELFEASRPEGRLLLGNTVAGTDDELLRPWLIATYRDLFCNVGFRLESEQTFTGDKDGARLEVLISLFRKPELPA